MTGSSSVTDEKLFGRRGRGPARPVTATISRTKLRPPTRQGGLVPRPALIERMCGQPRPRLALIQAAAGFGKTSLLSDIYRHLRERNAAAWLSLDPADNDYARLLLHLVAAIEASGIEVSPTLNEVFRLGGHLAPTTACDFLANALAGADRALTLCIDDVHLLTEPACTQLLSQLVLAPQAGVFWVLSSRTTPVALPLGRLRMLNELMEIDARMLKFSDVECAQFLSLSIGEPLEPALTRLLAQRTEGWVAGLQMASLSLKAAPDRAALIRGFSGTNKNVADFLQTAVFESLDDALLRFLLETSVLPRLTADLCNFVTGRSDARLQLDRLEALNLFIFSLDDERRWYRYHHLFSVFLEQRLRDSDPTAVHAVHLRASTWFEESGFQLEAIDHALRARAYSRAADLLDRASLYDRGHLRILEGFATQLPQSVLEQFPNLQLERIWKWEADWDFPRSRAALGQLARVLHAWRCGLRVAPLHVDLDYIAAKIAHREMMVAFVSDDMAVARRLCKQWLAARHPADVQMQVSCEGALMAADREHFVNGRLDVAVAALHEQYQRAQFSFGEVFQYCIGGLSYAALGNLTRAGELYRCAYDGAVALHGELAPLASMPALLLAELHYERNKLAECRALLGGYLEISYGLGFVDKLIAGYLTKARLEAGEGQREVACRTLDDAERCARVSGFTRLSAHVTNERIRQVLAIGDHEAALKIARQDYLPRSCMPLQPHDGVTSRELQLALAWSRLSQVSGDLDAGIRLMKNWYHFAEERGFTRAALQSALELATLLCARHDFSTACQYTCEALRLGARGGFWRTFIDGGEPVRNLLKAAHAGGSIRGETSAYAEELLRSFSGSDVSALLPPPVTAQTARLNELSRRELDILELAANDVPNREIARRLVLSEHTVKWYWKQIFGKLAVHRRLQAVISAREAGLIY
ncbi:MAG: LuxR C-terminal-related transcriptional regulator [Gammaproteobacteria bacterium]